MIFKFKIDQYDFPEPDGWQDMIFKVDRDLTNNFIYARPEGELTFTNTAFDYIYQQYLNNSFCFRFNLTVFYWCESCNDFARYFSMIINVADCEFNTFRNECKVKVDDNGWAANFKNNKKVQTYVNSNLTKNLLPIPTTPVYEITVFNPKAVLPVGESQGFRVYDVFKTIVAFTSDNVIAFESDFFNTGDGSGFFISTGNNLRTIIGNTTVFPSKLSFEQLYQSLMQKCNLGMRIALENGVMTLRIEENSYFYTNTDVVTLDWIKDETVLFLKDSLYSSVEVGSTTFTEIQQCDNGNTPCSLPQFDLYMFAQEQFSILGNCNIDRVLPLVSLQEISYDTNTIEDCVMYQNGNYDKTTFVINCIFDESLLIASAIMTQFYNSSVNLYNEYFTNYNCLQRWMNNGLPGGIANYYQSFNPANEVWEVGVNTPLCYTNWVQPNSTWNLWMPLGAILFNNIVLDPSTLYDASIGRITIQMPGVYNIDSLVRCIGLTDMAGFCNDNSNSYNFPVKIQYFFTIYMPDGTPLFTIPSPEYDHSTSFYPFDSLSAMVLPSTQYILDAGMYIQCELYAYQVSPGTPRPDAGGCNFVVSNNDTIFECTLATALNSGEVISDAVDYRIKCAKIQKHLSYEQLLTVVDNPQSLIKYTTLPNVGAKSGFIYSSQTNLATLKSEFQLLLQN